MIISNTFREGRTTSGWECEPFHSSIFFLFLLLLLLSSFLPSTSTEHQPKRQNARRGDAICSNTRRAIHLPSRSHVIHRRSNIPQLFRHLKRVPIHTTAYRLLLTYVYMSQKDKKQNKQKLETTATRKDAVPSMAAHRAN
ncbi:hypothetical protein J3F83DRAFT_742918 [Trichoderma novae-zelandiae]